MAKFVSAWLTPLPTQLPQHRFEPSIQGADLGHVTAPPDASCRRHLAPVERRDTGERGPRVEKRITDDPYPMSHEPVAIGPSVYLNRERLLIEYRWSCFDASAHLRGALKQDRF